MYRHGIHDTLARPGAAILVRLTARRLLQRVVGLMASVLVPEVKATRQLPPTPLTRTPLSGPTKRRELGLVLQLAKLPILVEQSFVRRYLALAGTLCRFHSPPVQALSRSIVLHLFLLNIFPESMGSQLSGQSIYPLSIISFHFCAFKVEL